MIDLKPIQKYANLASENIIIAGGALRHCKKRSKGDQDPLTDIDFFTKNHKYTHRLELQISQEVERELHRCPEGLFVSFLMKDGKKVQIINFRQFQSTEELINRFDFTICQIGYNGSNFVEGKRFEKHFQEKELWINEIEFPVSSLNRMHKYRNYGYRMKPESLKEFIYAVNEMERHQINDTVYID